MPISWSARKWCAFLLATLYFWVGGTFFALMMPISGRRLNETEYALMALRRYRSVNLEYWKQDGAWPYQIGRRAWSEKDYPCGVVSVIEDVGVFAGIGMKPGGDPAPLRPVFRRRAVDYLRAKRDPSDLVNSHGMPFDGGESLIFRPLELSPHFALSAGRGKGSLDVTLSSKVLFCVALFVFVVAWPLFIPPVALYVSIYGLFVFAPYLFVAYLCLCWRFFSWYEKARAVGNLSVWRCLGTANRATLTAAACYYMVSFCLWVTGL